MNQFDLLPILDETKRVYPLCQGLEDPSKHGATCERGCWWIQLVLWEGGSPLSEATKYLKLLQKNPSDSLETRLLLNVIQDEIRFCLHYSQLHEKYLVEESTNNFVPR
ncbi:uncharacterized protein [Arachis hypogaea]|uniref:uncharacterized protein n=1 Tax=Arachis hypogaea TaxID=3818 RepID=UPI003B216206